MKTDADSANDCFLFQWEDGRNVAAGSEVGERYWWLEERGTDLKLTYKEVEEWMDRQNL